LWPTVSCPFLWEILTLFFSTLFRYTARNVSAKHRTAPPFPGEAMKRGALLKLHGFNDFHGSGVNREVMPVSTKPIKGISDQLQKDGGHTREIDT
jgi:hypothetical protein